MQDRLVIIIIRHGVHKNIRNFANSEMWLASRTSCERNRGRPTGHRRILHWSSLECLLPAYRNYVHSWFAANKSKLCSQSSRLIKHGMQYVRHPKMRLTFMVGTGRVQGQLDTGISKLLTSTDFNAPKSNRSPPEMNASRLPRI